MKVRMPAAVAAALLVVALATACTPGPVTSPSPTPTFSSEAEAFAAAEATYRAYVDALNQVDLSDPKTFEAVFALTTGEASASIRKSLSEYHARDLTVGGKSIVQQFEPETANTVARVTAVACVDVSSVTLVDASGTSVVDSARPPTQTVQVQTVSSPVSPTGMLISGLTGVSGTDPC